MLDSFNVKITKLVKLPQVVVDNYPEEYEGTPNIVTLVVIEATGQKDGLSITEEKTFHVPFVKQEEFIDYSNLTEETILTWISADIEELKNRLEFILDKQIEEKNELLEDENDSPLPWNNINS